MRKAVRLMLLICVLLIASYWSIRPLTSVGFFPMHDDTQVGRVIAMGRALRSGQFPVRWVSDLGYGYGYPIFNFYGPLPYYVGGFLHMLGISGLFATKLMMMMGIILAGVTMFLAVVPIFGWEGALLASLLLLYAPYHAVQIYVRGAVGEFWALAFLPLLLRGLLVRDKHAALWAGSGLAGIILSHTVLGFITTFFLISALVVVWLIRLIRKNVDSVLLRSHMNIVGIGLGISAFFWLPATFEMQFTNVAAQIGPTANFRDHFVCLGQLWNSLWGFGGSSAGCIDGMSFKLGKVQLLVALVSLVAAVLSGRFRTFKSWLITSVAVLVGSIYFMLPVSQPLWELLSQFAYIQYPWRFLTFAIVSLALMGGVGVASLRHGLLRLVALIAVVAALLWINAKLFTPQFTYEKSASAFEDTTELRFRVSKISDEYLSKDFLKPLDQAAIATAFISAEPDVVVEEEVDTETYHKLFISTSKDTTVHLNLAHFPGWRYVRNGEEITPTIIASRPSVDIPKGRFAIEARFVNTPVRTIGNLLSVVTLGFLFMTYGRKTKKTIA